MELITKLSGLLKAITLTVRVYENLLSLRHSYATYLIEEGVNIVTVKELPGHADVNTTIIYLHVAHCQVVQANSPLDTLYKDAL